MRERKLMHCVIYKWLRNNEDRLLHCHTYIYQRIMYIFIKTD